METQVAPTTASSTSIPNFHPLLLAWPPGAEAQAGSKQRADLGRT